MKMEMWHSIHQDYTAATAERLDAEQLTVVRGSRERRCKTFRFVFECESMFVNVLYTLYK